jgi:hypothetical protein
MSLFFSLLTANVSVVVLLARHILPRHNIYDIRKVSSVHQAVIDLVEGVSTWRVSGLEVDLFVHEVRTFDRHLPACGKVDQSEAIFICTLVQTMLAYRWLMYGFPPNFWFRVFHHQLHVMLAPAVHKIDPWLPLLGHLLVHVC